MDQEIELLITEESVRQQNSLMMIPSENYASGQVRNAVGSILGNKYAEGYPGKRYYQGNKIVDRIENLAIERCKKLFNLEHANVQPYSGSPANSAVLFALLNPGDKVCGLSLSSGGHLTHGHPNITFSGKYFQSIQYSVTADGKIDYDSLAGLVKKEKPKLVFAGTTAYPFILDWKKFSDIAESVGAWLVADISHIAGLVAGGVHESPVAYSHLITSTTHKTLRGPRAAFIGITKKGLEKDPDLAKKIDRAVFPGMQGGPHINSIAGMAIAFEEAGKPEFKSYANNVVNNAKILADDLRNKGLKVIGTENHMLLIDVGTGKGREVAQRLEDYGIIVNANTIPFDQGSPMNPSGIRLGTPALTTRGMGEKEMKMIADIIYRVITNTSTEKDKDLVSQLCDTYKVL